MNFAEARAAWQSDSRMFAERGIHFPTVQSYVPDGVGHDMTIAMDAQPSLVTTPSGGIPAFLTSMVDPKVFRILLQPNAAAQALGEVRKGTWTDQVAFFPMLERVGEVSSYGDFNENGHVGVNADWPQRQAYLFQTIEEYGDLEIERAGRAAINWVAEQDGAAAFIMDRFLNTTYLFGVAGLQNYGMLNDPSLSAALTPATKAATGVKWISNGVIVATANEIFTDIQSLYIQLVNQTGSLVDQNSPMVLVLSGNAATALTATNNFAVSVTDLLKKNFPNLRIVQVPQYGAVSAANPQGSAGGNVVQLIATDIEGQETGYVAYNEKMRKHPIVRQVSSYKQKVTAGSWGAIIRQPFAIAQMIGV